jgi:hypothetical protein
MGEALRSIVRFRGNFFGLETGTAERFEKRWLRLG